MSAATGYSRPQIALHWIAALLILLQYMFADAIAHAWDEIGKGMTPAFDPMVMAHVIGGALVMLLALWRLSVRARRGAPEVEGENRAQRVLARLTHVGLYALMILMPVSGSLAWFGGAGAAAAGHNILKVVLLAFIALHVIGALYHQLFLKDGTMSRMLRPQP